MRKTLAVLGVLAFGVSVHATQTVQPVRDVAGTAFAGGGTAWTASVPVGTAVTVIGRYTTSASDGNESGLGLKVKYDETKFAVGSVTVTALSTKCMIAPPQVQSAGTASQAVLGWVDTAVRSPAGSVGWPYLADPALVPLTTSPCLNPNTPANDTSSTAAGAVNLFRFQGTLASGVAVGSTTDINITADGNFSYAATSPGMADQKVTITATAAPTLALAATNPYVSRKTHGATGIFDLVLAQSTTVAAGTPGTVTTVEPRQSQGGTHQIVIAFTSAITSAQFPTVSAVVGATNYPTATSFAGNEMTVTIGDAMTPIPNQVRLLISANGAGTAAGVNPSVAVAFLEGDVTNTATVNVSDILAVRLASGQAVSATTFLNDVTVSGGTINVSDILAVRLKSGVNLP